MSRVTVNEWLESVESVLGPDPELRHLVYVLARFMSGSGLTGCFPGTRELARRMGLSHAAVGRRALKLRQQGWVEVELRRRQYGRVGHVYFPSIPMEHSSVPISEVNGTPESSNETAMERYACLNGTPASEIGTPDPEIGTPERSRLLQTLNTEKSAASPSPANAGSAARKTDQELRVLARNLRGLSWSPQRIIEKHGKDGMTEAHLPEEVAT